MEALSSSLGVHFATRLELLTVAAYIKGAAAIATLF
jgi:hypothetical protein